MKQYKIKIQGVKPLIWHAFTPQAISLKAKPRTGKSGNEPDEWKATVLVDGENKLFVWGTYLFASLRDGSKNVKIGRGTLKSKIVSCLNVLDTIIYVKNRALPPEKDLTNNPMEPVYIDVCGVVNPNTKSRNIRYRIAASKGWELDFTIQWDDTIISPEQMEEVIRCAGMFAGLGDGRNVGMGRYNIISFEEI